MTPEERIARLEAELERERARADELQEIVHALAVKRRSSNAERQARFRERHGVTSTVTSNVTVTPLPPSPSLPPPSPSPSLSDPISPPPISSPNPSSPLIFPPPAVAAAAPEQAGLPGVAPPTPPAKPTKKAREAKKPETPTDPRHAQLVKALTDEGWPFDGGKDAANVKALLGLADQQEATRGELAGKEVLRRARIAWTQFPGYHSARTLTDLRSKWGYFAAPEPPKGGTPPALDVRRGGVRAELMDHTKPQEPF